MATVLFIECGIAKISFTRLIRPLVPLFVAAGAALLPVTDVLWLPRDVFQMVK